MNVMAEEDKSMADEVLMTERVRTATMLLVHESGEKRAVIRRAVDRAGLNARLVLEAANGYEALALIAAVKVDVALVSAEMKLMGSVELMARISERTRRHTECVLLVENEEAAKVAANYSTGASAQLMMPLMPEELRRVTDGILRREKGNERMRG